MEQKKDDEEDEMLSCEIEELYQQVITTFTDKALFVCLTLLDTLPETVYQVTDLLMAISGAAADPADEGGEESSGGPAGCELHHVQGQ